jgi:hypothetical protein
MGSVSGKALAFVSLLACVGCGIAPPPPASDASGPLFAGPTTWRTENAPAFTTPTTELRRVAAEFARAVCEYDARADTPGSFLEATASLTTPIDQSRLARSPRVRLAWPALKDRAEHTTFEVDGISIRLTDGNRRNGLVNGSLTTVTSFATVRSFVQLTLTFRGPLVDRAEGPCL